MSPQTPPPAGPLARPVATGGPGAPTLRPYQIDALEALVAFHGIGQNRLLMKLPTGTGKTVIFSALPDWPAIWGWLQQFPDDTRKMLVIAHREELLDQAAAKLQAANPHLMIGVEQAGRHATAWSDVVVASIQTLTAGKCRRLKALLTQHRFRLVIIDECHHAAAPSYRNALVHLGFLPPADAAEGEETEAVEFDDVAVMEQALQGWDAIAPQDQLLIGCTATPNRTDAIGLGCVFQTIAYSYELKKAIEDGWLVPIRPWAIETRESLDEVKITAGDFNQKQLGATVNTPARNTLAVAAWQEYAAGRSTIAFTVNVQHAHDLANAFRAAGISAEPLSGETPKDERRALLQAYTAGVIKVLTNCMVLTEGTDLPRTSCILHAKPTRSATLYEQMTGRALRILPGKQDCVLIDLVDVSRRHSLMTAPVLYGLPPGCKSAGEELGEMEEFLDDLRGQHPGFDLGMAFEHGPLTLAQLHALAVRVDPWAVQELPKAFGYSHALNWRKHAEDLFRLSYKWADGTESVTVQKDMLGQWEVYLELRSHLTNEKRQRTVAHGVETPKQAASLAEAFILRERKNVMRMLDKDAGWRKQRATPKQLQLLRKMRVPFTPDCTAGRASDLIDIVMAKRRR